MARKFGADDSKWTKEQTDEAIAYVREHCRTRES